MFEIALMVNHVLVNIVVRLELVQIHTFFTILFLLFTMKDFILMRVVFSFLLVLHYNAHLILM